MPNSFEAELARRGGFRTRTRIDILPPRQKQNGPRTGSHLSTDARSVGDRWYFAALPLYQFVVSKIEERFRALPAEEKFLRRKNDLLNEAKVIRNEHRNQVFEAVLPLFDVRARGRNALADGEPLPAADQHANGYLIDNVFHMMVQTYCAHLPEFVVGDLEESEQTFVRLAALQREKLQQELRNFEFGFRKVAAPR